MVGSLAHYDNLPAHKAVLKNALPAIVATLMQLVYNLADTFFIGRTYDDFQVAAVSLAFPVFMLFMATGTIFGIGGTSVISRAYGEGRVEYAKKVSSFCMWASVVIGLVLSAVFYIFMDQLLKIMGATDDTIGYARKYLMIVSAGGPFIMIGGTFSSIFRAEGKPGRAMAGQLIGNGLNIVLDFFLILDLGFGLGITGAAIATVIGSVVSAVFYLQFFLRGKSALSIHPRDFSVRDKICSGVLAIGIPSALGPLVMSFSQIVLNGRMVAVTDNNALAVAAAGVAGKVGMIISTVALGLSQGVQPLLGFSVGAANWKRYKEYMRFSLLFGTGVCVFITGLCYLFTPQIVGAFLTESESLSMGIRFAYIMQSTAFLFGIFFCFINALQAMGAAFSSLIVNVSRQGILYVPALLILGDLLGADGLMWSQPVVDVLSCILAVALHAVVYKKVTARRAAAVPSAE